MLSVRHPPPSATLRKRGRGAGRGKVSGSHWLTEITSATPAFPANNPSNL
jgi:hypothetical protein